MFGKSLEKAWSVALFHVKQNMEHRRPRLSRRLTSAPSSVNHRLDRPKDGRPREAAWPSHTPLRSAPRSTPGRKRSSTRAPTSAPSSAAASAAIPNARALVYLRTALDPAPVVTTAGDFLGLMRAATRWLRRNGVGPADVVSLLAPNCTATNIAYWAAMSSAAVQPLNLLFTREAIAAQVNAVKAKILFTPPPGAPGGLYEKVEGLQALAPSLERIVVLPLDGRVAFDGETLTPSDDLDNADVSDPNRIVALLPTGGTTGAPKVVPLSNRNVVSSAIGSMLASDLRPEDRLLVALPLFHVGGSFVGSLAALGAGATIVIPTAGGFRNPEVVANFWRIIDAQRVTISALVPTALGAAASRSA